MSEIPERIWLLPQDVITIASEIAQDGFVEYVRAPEAENSIENIINVADFDPYNRIEHAVMLEQDIGRRGVLKILYLQKLAEIVLAAKDNMTPNEYQWLLITATPEQRTRAYLATMEASDE